MTELVGLIAGLLLGLVAILVDRRRRSHMQTSDPDHHIAPPPKHTATEHANAHHTDTAAAVAAAADAHDVPAADVADDLAWLDADSDR